MCLWEGVSGGYQAGAWADRVPDNGPGVGWELLCECDMGKLIDTHAVPP